MFAIQEALVGVHPSVRHSKLQGRDCSSSSGTQLKAINVLRQAPPARPNTTLPLGKLCKLQEPHQTGIVSKGRKSVSPGEKKEIVTRYSSSSESDITPHDLAAFASAHCSKLLASPPHLLAARHLLQRSADSLAAKQRQIDRNLYDALQVEMQTSGEFYPHWQMPTSNPPVESKRSGSRNQLPSSPMCPATSYTLTNSNRTENGTCTSHSVNEVELHREELSSLASLPTVNTAKDDRDECGERVISAVPTVRMTSKSHGDVHKGVGVAMGTVSDVHVDGSCGVGLGRMGSGSGSAVDVETLRRLRLHKELVRLCGMCKKVIVEAQSVYEQMKLDSGRIRSLQEEKQRVWRSQSECLAGIEKKNVEICGVERMLLIQLSRGAACGELLTRLKRLRGGRMKLEHELEQNQWVLDEKKTLVDHRVDEVQRKRRQAERIYQEYDKLTQRFAYCMEQLLELELAETESDGDGDGSVGQGIAPGRVNVWGELKAEHVPTRKRTQQNVHRDGLGGAVLDVNMTESSGSGNICETVLDGRETGGRLPTPEVIPMASPVGRQQHQRGRHVQQIVLPMACHSPLRSLAAQSQEQHQHQQQQQQQQQQQRGMWPQLGMGFGPMMALHPMMLEWFEQAQRRLQQYQQQQRISSPAVRFDGGVGSVSASPKKRVFSEMDTVEAMQNGERPRKRRKVTSPSINVGKDVGGVGNVRNGSSGVGVVHKKRRRKRKREDDDGTYVPQGMEGLERALMEGFVGVGSEQSSGSDDSDACVRFERELEASERFHKELKEAKAAEDKKRRGEMEAAQRERDVERITGRGIAARHRKRREGYTQYIKVLEFRPPDPLVVPIPVKLRGSSDSSDVVKSGEDSHVGHDVERMEGKSRSPSKSNESTESSEERKGLVELLNLKMAGAEGSVSSVCKQRSGSGEVSSSGTVVRLGLEQSPSASSSAMATVATGAGVNVAVKGMAGFGLVAVGAAATPSAAELTRSGVLDPKQFNRAQMIQSNQIWNEDGELIYVETPCGTEWRQFEDEPGNCFSCEKCTVELVKIRKMDNGCTLGNVKFEVDMFAGFCYLCVDCYDGLRVRLRFNSRTEKYSTQCTVPHPICKQKTEASRAVKLARSRRRNRRMQLKEKPFWKTFGPVQYDFGEGKYRIRSFQSNDIHELHELDLKMTTQLMGHGGEHYGWSFLHSKTDLSRRTAPHWRTLACVALDGSGEESRPVGFIMYKLFRRGKPFVELFWILVDDEHRRQGLAQRLIDVMVLESRREWGVSSFRLHVLVNNRGGINLYKKMGFYQIDTKPNYPAKGYTSYRYRLDA